MWKHIIIEKTWQTDRMIWLKPMHPFCQQFDKRDLFKAVSITILQSYLLSFIHTIAYIYHYPPVHRCGSKILKHLIHSNSTISLGMNASTYCKQQARQAGRLSLVFLDLLLCALSSWLCARQAFTCCGAPDAIDCNLRLLYRELS